jgi:hypothetical protein
MGDNYYLCEKVCPTCKRPARKLHIGKSSGGWTFSFRGYRFSWDEPRLESYREWLVYLEAELAQGGEIRDEYDEVVSLDDFKRLVEEKESCPRNHTLYCRVEHPEHAKDCWLDSKGHSFTGTEFS